MFFDNKWKTCNIPNGVKWIDINNNLTYYAVGSKPSVKIKNQERQIACWRKDNNIEKWDEVPIIMNSWWNTFKTIQNDGFLELCMADTYSEPLVFVAEYPYFLDNISWFLYVQQKNNKFKAYQLKDKQL